MITTLKQCEAFHVAFLRQFSAKVRANNYAVKGGVNLRLFLGSVRYSEDMDIDVSGIETFKLKDVVMAILTSKSLASMCAGYQIAKIVSPDIVTAKQTDTTQRFKCHLITTSNLDLFTKIEFSRRNMEELVCSDSIDGLILRDYKLPPFMVSHYPLEVAVVQKIGALADRSQTRARDLFDIYMLLPRLTPKTLEKIKSISEETIQKAGKNVFNLSFDIYRDTVVTYLSDDDRQSYGNQQT